MPPTPTEVQPTTHRTPWRGLLRGVGLLVALGVVAFWTTQGGHRGWSQNQVPIKQLDPVTEIEFVTYDKRFVPGMDFLIGGSLVGILAFSATFLPRRRPS